MKIKSIELPKGLMASFADFLAEMNDPMEPLESSSGGKEILEVVDQIMPELAKVFDVLDRTHGANNFSSRMLIYKKEPGKDEKNSWLQKSIEAAEGKYINGNINRLVDLMSASMNANNSSVCIWVSPMPLTVDISAFFAFVLHADGERAAFTMLDGRVEPMPFEKKIYDITIERLLQPSKKEISKWESILRAHRDLLMSEEGFDLGAIMQGHNIHKYSNEFKKDVIESLLATESNINILQECSRMMATSHVRESQLLAEHIHNVIKLAEEHYKRKISDAEKVHEQRTTQMEKEHVRAISRFRKDLDKFNMSQKSIVGRNQILQKEVTELKKQLRDRGHDEQPDNSKSIGMALDLLFP